MQPENGFFGGMELENALPIRGRVVFSLSNLLIFRKLGKEPSLTKEEGEDPEEKEVNGYEQRRRK